MMRKILMLLALALATAIAMPHAVQAATPTEQELLIQKKKKAEAARKANARKLEAKKLEAEKLEAKRLAARKPDRRKQAEARRQSEPRQRAANRRDCGDFLKCLFGKKRNPNVRHASLARSDSGGVSDYATAEVVNWDEANKYSVGSIIVRTPERALYLVTGGGKARRYSVGVGREGYQWSGNAPISRKAEWPTWRPPQAMIKREAAKGNFLPAVMEGGPDNPLGARALYIGNTMYRIHGTNNASSIGGAVSSGCIRMMNADVVDLYGRVKVGSMVYVYQ